MEESVALDGSRDSGDTGLWIAKVPDEASGCIIMEVSIVLSGTLSAVPSWSFVGYSSIADVASFVSWCSDTSLSGEEMVDVVSFSERVTSSSLVGRGR